MGAFLLNLVAGFFVDSGVPLLIGGSVPLITTTITISAMSTTSATTTITTQGIPMGSPRIS